MMMMKNVVFTFGPLVLPQVGPIVQTLTLALTERNVPILSLLFKMLKNQKELNMVQSKNKQRDLEIKMIYKLTN